MQTVELKFTKLEKMPVPESKDEYLAKRYKDGSIAFFPAKSFTKAKKVTQSTELTQKQILAG